MGRGERSPRTAHTEQRRARNTRNHAVVVFMVTV